MMRSETKQKPTPASGQIWQRATYGAFTLRPEDMSGNIPDVLTRDQHFRCIGVETPAGRVMVGERYGYTPYLVRRIADAGVVCFVEAHGGEEVQSAETLLRWGRHETYERTDAPPRTTTPSVADLLADCPAPLAAAARASFVDTALTFDRVTVGGIEVPPPKPRKAPTMKVDFVMMPGASAEDLERLRATLNEEFERVARDAAATPLGCGYASPADLAAIGINTPPLTQAGAGALADRLGLKMADPRAERERRRREIDDVLREDARRFPAFATARRAAVLTMAEARSDVEMHGGHDGSVLALIEHLHHYERVRGGMSKPSDKARRFAETTPGWAASFAAYERARGLP